MPLKTTTNATIACDKGSKPANLQVTSQTHSKIDGVLIATEKDKEFSANIQPFGFCSISKSSCKCTPTKWEKTLKSKINGKQIFPKEGTTITFGGKKTYNFVSEDEVIDKAYTYFDYFIIRKKIDITKSYSRFPYEGRFHNLYYKSFRPRVHDKIKIKYSYN